jgi:hypothetical protein
MLKKDELLPGAKGCLGKAKDDEMLFILRAQDILAPIVVLEWIKLNFLNCPDDKLREAFEAAIKMKNYPGTKTAD